MLTPNALTAEYLAEISRRGMAANELASVAHRCFDLSKTTYAGRCLTRPVFLDYAQFSGLSRDLDNLDTALSSLPGRLFDGDVGTFARAVGMTEVQVTAILRDSHTAPTRLARADFYPDVTGFRLIEINKGSAIAGLDTGIGVVTGWLASPEEWAAQVDAAMHGPFVLQRRIRPVPEPFPAVGGIEEWVLQWGIIMGTNGYSGVIARGSTDPNIGLVNMPAGATGTCCFYETEPSAPS